MFDPACVQRVILDDLLRVFLSLHFYDSMISSIFLLGYLGAGRVQEYVYFSPGHNVYTQFSLKFTFKTKKLALLQ